MPTAKHSARQTQSVIALDLGGTKLAAALFGAEGKPLDKHTVPLESRSGSAVGELVLNQIHRLQQAARRRKIKVSAIAVCVPGIAQPRTGRVWAPNIPGWDDYRLKAEIRSAVADSETKIVVTSDRAASIVGEAWQGAARGCRNAIFLAVGTGIGAGILVDGRVLDGAHGIAGAIGWLALSRPFRSDYAACGCFESHASGEGIAKMARAAVAKRKGYRGRLRNAPQLTAHDVCAAYEAGDEVAKEVLTQAIEFWGMASANLISLFNPEKIVFGGGVFGPAERFLGDIASEARRWAQPVAVERVKFEASKLGGDAALYGTGYSALLAARLSSPSRKSGSG